MGLVGFFDKELLKPVPKKRVVSETRKKPITNPCEACGLYKQCNSPKMKYTGKGKEKILIIAEAPGSSEDEKGVQLIGEAGQILRDSLKIFGMDLDRDFWKTNSVICRPPKNRKPTRRELKLCRFNIENAIKELKPKFIWLMGGSAVESFYMERFSDTLAINIWRKRLIPDYDHNCFIIPMFHPSYILRNQDVKLEMIFKSDLKWALSCLDKELPAPVNIDKVKVLTDVNKILTQLKHVLDTKEKINFDYETSRLNPHIKGGKIWTIAYNGISFGLDHPEAKHSIIALEAIETLWKKILTDPEIQKTAQNLKFEDGWSRARFGVVPKGWIHDTMVTQHILEHRPTSTALKFQSYVRWGVPYYEKETEKYIIKGSREPNTLDKMPMHDLCVYNAIDTLMSDRLEKEQKRELKKYPDLTRANDLFFEGTLTFCDIESYGICIDEKWYNTRNKKLTLMCDELEDKMKNSREARKFKRKTGKELLITSNKDLSLLFFDVLELTPMKTTDKGAPSVDVEALSAFNLPFINDLLKYRKLIKIRDAYLAQFIRENVNGKIYPSFKIHTVDTYRSSSSNPNFQNIPVRDEEARKETRSGIIPTKGNKLLEVDYCFPKETLIKTIDGEKTIKEIVDNYKKQPIYVYGYNKDKKRVCISKVTKGCLSKIKAKLISVVLDNGKIIRCTPEHNFMLRTGEYCPACKLKSGDSLMPLYTSVKRFSKKGKHSNYLNVNLNNGQRMLLHNLIAEDVFGIVIKGSNLLVHHKNGNGLDNTIKNLEIMDRKEHMKIHAIQSWASPKKKRDFSWAKSECGKKIISERSKLWWSSLDDFEKNEFIVRCQQTRKSKGYPIGEKNPMFGKLHSIETKKKISETKKKQGIQSFLGRTHSDETKKKISEANKGKLKGHDPWNKGKHLSKFHRQKVSESLKGRVFSEETRKKLSENKKIYWELFHEEHNHKVVSVIDYKEKADVYSIAVEDCHNFALDVGVIVKNCAMEVRICACYTKDPALIQYINNPKSDMHKDQAKKLFKLNENEVTKDIRFHAKNGFVFPEIYGSYFVTCANNLWKEAKLLKTKTGQPLLEHLKDRRIHSINDFTDHVKSVEDEFWNTFPLIKEWTEDNTEFYLRRGYIPFLFGHRRSGFLSRNAISNYPIQGAAFHCLFWSLIQLGKIALKEKWKTKRIGQIHDSIVFDLHPSEEDHVVEVVKRVMTQDIRKQFDFLIVPLEVEFDITEIDGSWYTKKSLKIGK